jgi:hypothetical protein
MGVHRSTYYHWKRQVDRWGLRRCASESAGGRGCPTRSARIWSSGSWPSCSPTPGFGPPGESAPSSHKTFVGMWAGPVTASCRARRTERSEERDRPAREHGEAVLAPGQSDQVHAGTATAPSRRTRRRAPAPRSRPPRTARSSPSPPGRVAERSLGGVAVQAAHDGLGCMPGRVDRDPANRGRTVEIG